jgi:hypothetical protein
VARFLARLALVAGLAAACGGALGPAPRLANPVSAIGERDGVRVTLSLPQRAYGPGEVIWADVKIENTTDAAVSWLGGGCNFPARVGAKPAGAASEVSFIPESAWQSYVSGAGGPICTMDIRENKLPAHQSLTLRAGWDGSAQRGGARAPDGEAEITAIFPFGTIAAPNPIFARATITLTDR